jgi:hypothetical protein
MRIEIIYCIQDKKASFISRFYGEPLDKSLPIAYHRNCILEKWNRNNFVSNCTSAVWYY